MKKISKVVNGTLDEFANVASRAPGASNYTDLTNKPQINDVTLVGNKSFSDLGLIPISDEEIEALFE